MKNILIVSIVNLATFAAFAKANVNQIVADAVRANTEIQAVVKAITDTRGIKCDGPGDEETTVGKLLPSGTKFSAIYNCNEYDVDGQPQANYQQIIIKGTAYLAAPGNVSITFQALEIVEFE